MNKLIKVEHTRTARNGDNKLLFSLGTIIYTQLKKYEKNDNAWSEKTIHVLIPHIKAFVVIVIYCSCLKGTFLLFCIKK
ncbi:hypothetical protein AYJ08_00200 [Brevibacillus sp. SKDU10]|nr:hypothetical protein AYJ08_00200 [Brevibacillus sp. SKDU10]